MRLSIEADDMFGPRGFCTLPCVAALRKTLRRALFTFTALITAVVVAGCGGGSSKHHSSTAGSAAAHRLLVQTFDGHHGISSGVITLDLQVVPSGSSSIKGPIKLAFGGPFVNKGAGKLPESDFTISISAEGHVGALQVISADGKGYITVSGQSYKLPASSYKSLESGFGSLASSGTGSGSSKSAFSKLGIKPLAWLVRPQVVGKATVDGVATTQIRAGLDATAMLQDFSTLLGKAGSLGVSGTSSLPKSISASTQHSIAHALGTPSFNLWTGTTDKLIRRLTVSAVVPVTGATRTALGGMRSATITLGFEYSRVNQPQTITVPTSTKPYSVFRTEFAAILSEIESGLISGSTGSSTTTGGAGGSGSDQKYTQCITAAKGAVAKMQKCAKLLATG
jgi:hypothetical protein